MAAEAARFTKSIQSVRKIWPRRHSPMNGVMVSWLFFARMLRKSIRTSTPMVYAHWGQGRRWRRQSLTIVLVVVGEEADSGKSIDASSPQGSPSGSRGCFGIDHTTALSRRQRDPLGVSVYQFPRSIANCIESDIYFQKGQ